MIFDSYHKTIVSILNIKNPTFKTNNFLLKIFFTDFDLNWWLWIKKEINLKRKSKKYVSKRNVESLKATENLRNKKRKALTFLEGQKRKNKSKFMEKRSKSFNKIKDERMHLKKRDGLLKII